MAVDIDLPTSGEFCFGRNPQLKKLSQIWNDGSKNIISIVARGGEGKTTLINHWLNVMAVDDFRGAERVFARSFYSQGTSERAASADKVIDEALRFFGENEPEKLSPYDRGIELARRVGSGRNLLVLDGMEPLQYPPGEMEGEIKDPSLETLLKSLQYHNNGLCLVTTREEIRPLQGAAGHEEIILKRLTKTAARQLLRKLGVTGDQQAIDLAIEENEGHALAVTLLGTYLVERFGGDIADIDRVTSPAQLLKGGERESAHARKMIASYEKWFEDEPDEVNSAALVILRFLGLFNRPPEPGCIAALREQPIVGLSEALFTEKDREETWRKAILRLEKAKLLERSGDGWNEFDCHPLIREYFAERMDMDFADSAREAHYRLYEYLQQFAPELPGNLHDLMPLYHAVAHGCKAEEFEEAYDVLFRRIQRGAGYSWLVLGAHTLDLYAVEHFFYIPWQEISRKASEIEGEIYFATGCSLMVIGRLELAAECFDQALNHLRRDHLFAFISAGNASELRLMVGHIDSAVSDARRYAAHAVCVNTSILDQFPSENKEWLTDLASEAQLNASEWFAALLYLTGHPKESEELFHDTVQMASINFSFRYWYFRISFDRVLEEARLRTRDQNLLNHCRILQEHVGDLTKNQSSDKILIYHGLMQLTQAELHAACALMTNVITKFDPFEESLRALRSSGATLYIALALLSRATWMIHLGTIGSVADDQIGDALAVAERDLSEAEGIAKRFSFVICQIEAALERTRLYLVLGDVKAAHQKLEEAKQLVKQTEKPYEPYIPMDEIWPDGQKWEPPEYVGVFKKGDIVGYHRRNGEIERLERELAQSSP